MLVLQDENGDVPAEVDDTARGREEPPTYDIEPEVDCSIELSSDFGSGTFEPSIEVS